MAPVPGTAAALVNQAAPSDGRVARMPEESTVALDADTEHSRPLPPSAMRLARRCAAAIDRLPTREPNSPEEKRVHKISHTMKGLESCEICGQSVSMGYWQIVDPGSNTALEVPMIARHFMQHDSFAHLGSAPVVDRAAVATLLSLLELPAEGGASGISDESVETSIENLHESAERWLDPVEATNR